MYIGNIRKAYLTVGNLVSTLVCTNNGISIKIQVSKYNHSYGTYSYIIYELNHVIRKHLDGRATGADFRASASENPIEATSLATDS